jgi:hypothetical protein
LYGGDGDGVNWLSAIPHIPMVANPPRLPLQPQVLWVPAQQE